MCGAAEIFTCPVARVIQFVGARANKHVHEDRTHKPCQEIRTDSGREPQVWDEAGITL